MLNFLSRKRYNIKVQILYGNNNSSGVDHNGNNDILYEREKRIDQGEKEI